MKIAHTIVYVMMAAVSLVACKSSPEPGTACESENSAVCKDDKTIMNCKGGKWEQLSCKGPKGCGEVGTLVQCDMSLGVEGEPCGSEENHTCSEDKKHQLKCVDAKWKTVALCRGPEGCEASGVFAKCDTSVAEIGDLCSKEDDAACAADGKAILQCKSNKFAEAQKCPDSTRCNSSSIMVRCE